MSEQRRRHEVMIRLNDAELARLDENRPDGIARAVYLRGLLRKPPSREDIADRREVLALLSEQARAGKVAAAIALMRALKDEDEPNIHDALERILGRGEDA
jgi:hypothetical protein